ncbi:hypothetical protein HanPI659440_Chr04g0172961 [Helianthus annuus]|nr:hypothetical protein HanPI659440_Chr04g0172961 [Helianthus annuus]
MMCGMLKVAEMMCGLIVNLGNLQIYNNRDVNIFFWFVLIHDLSGFEDLGLKMKVGLKIWVLRLFNFFDCC